jgi:hypothetical protein
VLSIGSAYGDFRSLRLRLGVFESLDNIALEYEIIVEIIR